MRVRRGINSINTLNRREWDWEENWEEFTVSISFAYIENDFDANNEYLVLSEVINGVSNEIATCGVSGRDTTCVEIDTCLNDESDYKQSLNGDYSDGSSIDIIVYASVGVDGQHWGAGADVCPNGPYTIDAVVTITCQREAGNCI